MEEVVVTEDTFQLFKGWLKAEAKRNIKDIVVTEDTSQLPMGWLKAEAEENILFIVVTEDTFQLLKGWLKVEAKENMKDIEVTDDTFQLFIFPEIPKLDAPLNALSNKVVLFKSSVSVAVRTKFELP